MMETELVEGEAPRGEGKVAGMVEDKRRVAPRCSPKVSFGRLPKLVEYVSLVHTFCVD